MIEETPMRTMTLEDWKALAIEAGNKLAFAVARLKAPPVCWFDEEGNFHQRSWEDDVCETLTKFPGAKIDRDAISDKYLSKRERARKAAKR